MRALVTGGAGFVGSVLTRRLAERGDTVRVLDSPAADRSRLEGVPADFLAGDILDHALLGRALEGIDTVLHLAGVRRAPNREGFMRVNAEGTRRLCEAAAATGRRLRLVLAGSIAATGPRKDSPDETAPFAPVDWYGESKAEAEQIAFSFGDRLDVAVARPSRILGPGDQENLFFFQLALRGIRVELGGGPRQVSTIDVSDAVDAFLLLADRPEAVGQAFFVSHETTTMEGLQDAVAAALGAKTHNVHVPAGAFRALGSTADVFSLVTRRHLPVSRKVAQQLLAPGWTCSTEKARRVLGFSPKVKMAESLAAAAAWYRAQGSDP